MDIDKWFSTLLDDPVNELVRKAMDEGQIPIGYSCSYVPEVMLSVDGLFPVRMRAPGIAGTELADNYLSSVICSYTRSLLEFALDGRYDFLQGWVFAASCDHLRRLYDNLEYLRRPGFSRILDVPHKTGEAAITWYTEELRLFAKALADHFGCDLGADALGKAIREHNRFNAILREIGEHRRGDHPAMTGTEYHRLVIAANASPKKAFIPILEKIRDDLPTRTPLPPYRARLLLVGGHLDDPGYIGIIESQGGLVVGDRLCTGSYPGLHAHTGNGRSHCCAGKALSDQDLLSPDDGSFQGTGGRYCFSGPGMPGGRCCDPDFEVLRHLGCGGRLIFFLHPGSGNPRAASGAGLPPRRRGTAPDAHSGVYRKHG